MAFIPDEIIDRMYAELSSGARDLYIFLARCRNQKTGRCFPSIQTTSEAINLSRARIYAVRKELETKKWAKFEGSEVFLLVGFKSLENKTDDIAEKELTAEEAESLENKTSSLENETDDSTSEAISLENETNSLENKTNESCFQDKKSQKQDSPIRKNQQKNQQREPANKPASGATSRAAVIREYEIFANRFRDVYGMPYVNKRADFVQFHELKTKCEQAEWLLTEDRFRQAMENYFGSELGSHTFADLCTRFSSFYRGRLDRFSKPPVNGLSNGKPNLRTQNEQAFDQAYEILFNEKRPEAPPYVDAEVIQ